MKEIKVKIFRTKKGKKVRYDIFKVPFKEGITILDLLNYIKENIDPSLTFRAFCRSGVCGSCTVRVNGKPLLACKTQIKEIVDEFEVEKLIIEPIDGFKIIKDLVVDIEGKQDTLRRFKLWLENKIPPENEEFKISPDEVEKYSKETDCILCLTCCSVCETLKENTPFAGPFAFVKTYRFIADSREKEETHKERVKIALNASVWSCVQCQKCVAFCPKNIAPAHDIQKIRNETVKLGHKETPGARKLSHYLNWVYATGQINRLYLPLDVYDNEKAVRDFINFCKEHGVEIWEIPHLPDGFLALRDLIIRALIEEGDIESINFKKIRQIDEKIEKLLKGDNKCE
ncbi:succinate dehydrogenase/fumarate reductase iron-sulfur subunit [Desulfurobacterium atlanticum]|uniref:Fumarate reductase iron-sulfur subunit n=1 Tax=Desulfurobacterium atlanticum TaxID=240169 RepID=A0A238YGS1_9BACT|nr:succinate dehydrogenase/fumarate reductase iron-sulfur subunit [Desulfurobacterium atlanticum]SNR69931.1 succinate dehydrogenase / fumarate reductase iron-sulfur subunit [Desulfurobacterium atlanticum]